MLKFEQAQFCMAAALAGQLPAPGLPEIAFAGRSNVGKSSLINKLAGRKSLARTSATPGKTATVNFYGVPGAWLVDLPGYGYAKTPKSEKERWRGLLDGYFCADRPIRLVVQLIDMRHPPMKDDTSMLEYLQQTGYRYIIALTKSDKLGKTQREQRLESLRSELSFLGEYIMIPCSAVKGEGVEQLRNLLSDVAEEGE